MPKALYRKYRSRKLSEIVGQDHVTSLLSRAIETDRVAHAYLFTGPRGVGKTSIARILAHEINNLDYNEESNYLDIIEIDAASNNGVDDIRELREKVSLAPVHARKKVYIIDEVHMLSKPAFNALLKTLEEPPEHVVFVLATTDVEKLPDTIISRTQRHTFKRASIEHIVQNLTNIAKKEKIAIDKAALQLIAEHSDGSYRDSVSLLDQLSSASDETLDESLVEASLGLAPSAQIFALLNHINKQKFDDVIHSLNELHSRGIQPKTIADQLIREIQKQLQSHPEYMSLLDDLLLVAQSPMPEAKLLAVAGKHSSLKRPSAKQPVQRAAAVTAPRTSRPVEIPELAAKASETHPKDDIVSQDSESMHKNVAKKSVRAISATTKLDWVNVLDYLKDEGIGLTSVLSKCQAVAENNTVTIYAKNEFYKKKLENARYQKALHGALSHQSDTEWEIIVVPGSKPSDNRDVASITAIMGGGEEVSIDDSL